MSNPNSTQYEENVCLSVLCVNTDYSQNFIRTIQSHFPDVNLQIEYYAAANSTSEYIVRLLESGNGPDIVYSGTVFEEKLQKEYLLDLSVYNFAGRYSVSIMNQRDQVMADLLHETGGDVAVVSDGTFINNVPNATGVSGRLFIGTFNREASYSINIPGAMNKHVMHLTLTGKELFSLLEGGRSVTEGGETAVFDYYWSGMDAVMENGKITSAALPDGREVQPDEKYQVTICGSDYDEEAYPNGEDTGVTVSEAYLKVMEGKTLTAPDKVCR